MNRLEENLKNAQAELAAKTDEARRLAELVQLAEINTQEAAQDLLQRDALIASLQAQLQETADALENQSVLLLAAQREAGELADEIGTHVMTRTTLETHLQAKTAVLATAEAVIASMKASFEECEQQLADLRILTNERGRELDAAQAQIAYLISGMDDLNNTANEKYAALKQAQAAYNEAQTALEIAEGRIGQLNAEQELLKTELAGALQRNEARWPAKMRARLELTSVLENASEIQTRLDAAQAQIERLQFEAMAVLAANQLERAICVAHR